MIRAAENHSGLLNSRIIAICEAVLVLLCAICLHAGPVKADRRFLPHRGEVLAEVAPVGVHLHRRPD